MNINQRQEHTVTHRIDPAQFAVLAHFADALLHVLASLVQGDDPAAIKALAERLKASADVLAGAVKKANPPNPQEVVNVRRI